jgi:hypothetical protein
VKTSVDKAARSGVQVFFCRMSGSIFQDRETLRMLRMYN